MILDKIVALNQYSEVNPNIIKAIRFLKETNLSDLGDGRIEIDTENIYALISSYKTKNENESYLEVHRKYIDIQILISGKEKIGYEPLRNQEIIEEYSEEKDYAFHSGNQEFFTLKEGSFAMFFPTDLHQPGIKVNKKEDVRKLVLKLKVL